MENIELVDNGYCEMEVDYKPRDESGDEHDAIVNHEWRVIVYQKGCPQQSISEARQRAARVRYVPVL